MTKRMSKTLAAEIATRTLEVTSPLNRAIALSAALADMASIPALPISPNIRSNAHSW